ncbi:Hypothetical protein SMAX5B_006079 [Scophthalmus maximus]|uniref:Uncharacterized protein n=1 Tax=Scophthalmus maximus TaxID=52904 RepID=A0A2U9CVW0_SCOMX|nr:Hypothetical protein SMAX5B_006079 [Scophthalmus maximus]KAF0032467.1 hypothetical protein F2P81_014757 [Scophthalmus maximus]
MVRKTRASRCKCVGVAQSDASSAVNTYLGTVLPLVPRAEPSPLPNSDQHDERDEFVRLRHTGEGNPGVKTRAYPVYNFRNKRLNRCRDGGDRLREHALQLF